MTAFNVNDSVTKSKFDNLSELTDEQAQHLSLKKEGLPRPTLARRFCPPPKTIPDTASSRVTQIIILDAGRQLLLLGIFPASVLLTPAASQRVENLRKRLESYHTFRA